MEVGELDAVSKDRSSITLRTMLHLGSPKIDWGKWGSLAGIVALPLAIILWWFS